MSKSSDDSPFGGFFVAAGGITGLFMGLSAAGQAGDELLPGAIAGVIVGLMIGYVVEHVLGAIWKLLMICIAILFFIVRIQTCSAIREGVQQGLSSPSAAISWSVAESDVSMPPVKPIDSARTRSS